MNYPNLAVYLATVVQPAVVAGSSRCDLNPILSSVIRTTLVVQRGSHIPFDALMANSQMAFLLFIQQGDRRGLVSWTREDRVLLRVLGHCADTLSAAVKHCKGGDAVNPGFDAQQYEALFRGAYPEVAAPVLRRLARELVFTLDNLDVLIEETTGRITELESA